VLVARGDKKRRRKISGHEKRNLSRNKEPGEKKCENRGGGRQPAVTYVWRTLNVCDY
jgi:hypothetical protein